VRSVNWSQPGELGREASQFAVAVINHSALSSAEMRSDEMSYVNAANAVSQLS